MKFFDISLRVFVFATALLLGTTGVVAARFAISTIATAINPPTNSDHSVAQILAESDAEFPDLRNADKPSVVDDFDATGDYSIAEGGPRDFADIDFIDISTREYVEQNGTYIGRPIVPTGSLRTTKEFAFTKISIGGREISFQTENIDGISYRFIGNFPISSEIIACEGCEYPGDVAGQLTKLKNGKVVAEMYAKFYFNGC